MGNKLFGDNDAVVKHVEYPPNRGRGIKIFIDKLVFTFFFLSWKMRKSNKKERKKPINFDEKRTKRNLFVVEKFLDGLHYIDISSDDVDGT